MRTPCRFLALFTAAVLAALQTTANAETMQCFNGAIDAAEIDPPSREEVEQRCGQPDERDGGVWVYRKSQFVYRLSFDNEGKLYLIQRRHRD